jgi:hypothetical protein
MIAVDCSRNRVYVARLDLSVATGDGLVEVLNSAADPDTTNPHVATIDLGHKDYPIGVAVDQADGIVIVVSGDNGTDGKLDLISEATNTLITGSPFHFPAGTDVGHVGQVVFDPTAKQAIVGVSPTGTPAPKSQPPGPKTGFVAFTMSTHTFGNIIESAGSDGMGIDVKGKFLIAASDYYDLGAGTRGLVDAVSPHNSCTLTDTNIANIDDAENVGFDPNTHIAVIGDDGDNDFVVVNLNKATFSGASLPCSLNEAGTPPNSVFMATSAIDDPANIAVNPVTHEVFLGADGDSEVGLATLPTTPQTQISGASITLFQGRLPDDPKGNFYDNEGFPYSAAVDTCHNKGWLLNDSDTFAAQVDLAKLKSNPAGINTALPAGTCAGYSFTNKCNNQNGAVFFPLPPV